MISAKYQISFKRLFKVFTYLICKETMGGVNFDTMAIILTLLVCLFHFTPFPNSISVI
jgi:hypothetical protein